MSSQDLEAASLLTELQRQVQSSDQVATSPAYLDNTDYIEQYQQFRKICSSRYGRIRELKNRLGYILLIYRPTGNLKPIKHSF